MFSIHLRASFSKNLKTVSQKHFDVGFEFSTFVLVFGQIFIASSPYDIDFIAIKILKSYKGFDHEKWQRV